MNAFDLQTSLDRAAKRLAGHSSPGPRRRRSDAGTFRLAPAVERELRRLLLDTERPPVRNILATLEQACARLGHRRPSRATVYKYMARGPGHTYDPATLPPAVRAALYNLADDAPVPGHQLAFYALNYGDLRAAMFAAALPWLDLYQAAQLRGWRPRSRALLRAVRKRRGI